MKIHSYILLLALGVLAARCGDDETVEFGGRLPGSEDGGYESHWYYSYEAARLIDAESLGMSASVLPVYQELFERTYHADLR